MERNRSLKLLAAAVALAAGNALAQDYPSRPITVIVPFAAGGSVDTTARFVLPKLSERLKQPIVVENVPGAAGTIGTTRAVRAAPDGYTLLFAVASPITIAKLVTPSTVSYESLKDLAPIATVGVSPFALVGKPSIPAKDAAELVALIKKEPGKLSYATDGVGTSMHLTGELIKQRANLKFEHVPYKLGPQIVNDLAGNQVDLAILPLILVQEAVKSGRIKGFGVTSKERWPSIPNLPALAETPELKDVESVSWYGLLAPAKIPPAIANRLATEMAVVLDDPAVVAKMGDLALKPMKMTPEQFTQYLQKERDELGAVVKAGNIKAE